MLAWYHRFIYALAHFISGKSHMGPVWMFGPVNLSSHLQFALLKGFTSIMYLCRVPLTCGTLDQFPPDILRSASCSVGRVAPTVHLYWPTSRMASVTWADQVILSFKSPMVPPSLWTVRSNNQQAFTSAIKREVMAWWVKLWFRNLYKFNVA